MTKTGRPKVDKPINHVVTVKFREEEYELLSRYADKHNLTVSQTIRMAVELQLKRQPDQ